MRLLMFYAYEWWYRTARRSLPEVPDVELEERLPEAVVVFFHAESEDAGRQESVLRKFVKNTKWLAGKFGTRNVVLHSFNHLGTSKASPEVALGLLAAARERLERAGYRVLVTPFGYFNEFRMHVAGESLAKVYKEF